MLWLAACLLLVLFAGGCATVQLESADSKEVRFHNWWNFYRRGTVFVAEKNWRAAKEDFERALGTRPGARFGYAEELWRARTYGLHFIEGYFPHRELGVCLYHLGQFEKAEELLEKSMRQEPSGRAKHYLNLARSKQLKAAMLPPPTIAIDGLKNVNYVKERRVLVSGTASAEGLIGKIQINGMPEFIELAQAECPFSRELQLKQGSNLVSVIAEDLAGARSRKNIVVLADWEPPVIALRKIEKQADGWKLTMTCSDDSALASLKLDGVENIGPAMKTKPKSGSFDCVARRNKPLVISATDIAGNSIQAVYTRNELDRLAFAGGPPLMYASALPPLAMTDMVAEETQAAVEEVAAGHGGKPSLELLSEATGIILRDEFYLDGIATARDGLNNIALNGSSILKAAQKAALQVRFARRLPLNPGTNSFMLAVSDTAGKNTEKRISLIRRDPDYLDSEYRLRIEVPAPLRCDQGQLRQVLRRQLEAEITREPTRFHLMERDEQALELILRELELSASPLADKKAALQIGKILPVEMVLFCSLIRNGVGLTLFARIVDASTGEIVWTGDVYAESEQALVDSQIAGLVMKTEQQFPLIEGHIATLKGGTATIDAGDISGMKPGSKLLVVQGIKSRDSIEKGFVVKADGRPVELEITRVKGNTGVGRITPSQATDKVKEGDYVYSR